MSDNKQQQTEDLASFKWDDKNDFFNIDEPIKKEEKVKEVKEEVKEEIKEEINQEGENVSKEKEVKEEKEEFTFFQDEKEEDKDKEEVVETEKTENVEKEEDLDPDDDVEFFSTLASELKEKGILSYDPDKDKDIDEEKFFELQNNEIDNRVEEKLKGFFEELDQDAVAFLQYKQSGGNTSDFFKILQSSFDVTSIKDMNNESDQESVIRFQLEKEGFDYDEISDRINWLKDGGKLKKTSEQYLDKLIKEDAVKKQQAVEQERLAVEQQKQNIRKRNDSVKNAISNSDVLKQFNLKDTDKNDLFNYITKPSVKVGQDKYYTKLQQAMTEIYNNPEKLLLLSQIVKSDFNFDTLKVKLNNEIIKETKSRLKDINKEKRNLKNTYTSSQKNNQRLVDYFK